MYHSSSLRGLRSLVVGGLLVASTACHGLLDVTDPTLVQDPDVATTSGANARRLWAVAQLAQQVPAAAADVAVFTDERRYDLRFTPSLPYADRTQDLDARNDTLLLQYDAAAGNDSHLGLLVNVFTATSIAIPAIRAYAADSLKHEYLAQLFAMRGYLIAQLAEDLCPGFPINDVSADNLAIYSGPYTRTSALQYAITQLDSALANGHDSTSFLDLARVIKGRTLLDLGQYAEAGAAVAAVSPGFVYTTDATTTAGFNTNVLFQRPGPSSIVRAVGDNEGGTGLPFVSAHDPRVITVFKQVRYAHPADSLYDQTKYPSFGTPIVIASAVEARLIAAEAALHEPNPGKMMDTLNALRATVGLGALPTPATTDAQVDLLYRERAFWLYLTGRRLGDVRRLILNYGRNPETVFPTGAYPNAGVGPVTYGSATAIPFSADVQARTNPHITMGCTTR